MPRPEEEKKGNTDELKSAVKADFERWGFDPGIVDFIDGFGEIRRFRDGNGFALEVKKRESPKEDVTFIYDANTQTAKLDLFDGGLPRSILLLPPVVVDDIKTLRVTKLLGLPVIAAVGEKAVLIMTKDAQFAVRTFRKDGTHPFTGEQGLIEAFYKAIEVTEESRGFLK